MLTLNLLPEQYKYEYRFEKKKRFFVFVILSCSSVMALFAALLVSVYLFLQIQEKSLKETFEIQQSAQYVRHASDLEKEVNAANVKIDALEKARKQMFPVSPALDRLTALIKPGLYLENFSLRSAGREVSMSGFAESRDLVLELESLLASNEIVESGSVYSPIRNILKNKDINFTFRLQLKKQ